MLSIKDLHASINGKEILKGFGLEVKPGEVHAIMGPNGTGKSTLANILAGKQDYDVTEGTVTFQGKDLLDMAPEERAREGILGFPIPSRNTRREYCQLYESLIERSAQAPRLAAIGCCRVFEGNEGENALCGNRREVDAPRRKRRF